MVGIYHCVTASSVNNCTILAINIDLLSHKNGIKNLFPSCILDLIIPQLLIYINKVTVCLFVCVKPLFLYN